MEKTVIQFKSDKIQTIFDFVLANGMYQSGIEEEILDQWKSCDREFATIQDAIKALQEAVPGFPEIDVEDEDEEPTQQVIEEQPLNFEHTVIEDEDYMVAVFTAKEQYLTSSSIKQTKDMYVRRATEKEIADNKVYKTEQDEKELEAKIGQIKDLSFDSENVYYWGKSEKSLKVSVKNSLIYFEGALVGKVENGLPFLTNTTIAKPLFVKPVEIQQANIQGGDFSIIAREDLDRITNERNDFEVKLRTITSRIGLNQIENTPTQLAQRTVEIITEATKNAKEAGEKLLIAQKTIDSLKIQIANLQKEVPEQKEPKFELKAKPVFDIEEGNPMYVAYYKSEKDNTKNYIVVKEDKSVKHTKDFLKAYKASKSEILSVVLKIMDRHPQIKFTIARLIMEIQ